MQSARGRGPGRGGGRGQYNGGRGRGRKPLNNGNYFGSKGQPLDAATGGEEQELNYKAQQQEADDRLEATLGFPLFSEGPDKLGWLLNISPASYQDTDSGQTVAAVDLYFMCQDGSMFKARMAFPPYFYLQLKDDMESEMEVYLRRKYESRIHSIEVVHKEDLDLKNHLSGIKRKLLKINFWNVQQLMEVKKEFVPVVARNRKAAAVNAYAAGNKSNSGLDFKDVLESVVDMREYDVPYHVRFEIDNDIRCGHWFTVSVKHGVTSLSRRHDLLTRGEVRICAFDIETTKLPLQFPNAEYDQVFMISYMIDKKGFLIVNREIVTEDISSFEYTPKPEFDGPFTVFNEPNEVALLRRFFEHMREVKPGIYVTYNGDYFDWPFIETRASKHGMDMKQELGFAMRNSECLCRAIPHMDCLHWVNRDSYLPQGSRGLKAVTKAKLGYDPVEVHPEDMLNFAREKPQTMAAYSVSDAVATYYLYMTYIHPFIFSLATIIPMPPDEVLRKGSGTLCEQLLMVQAFQKNIICPNKHTAELEVFYKGHLLESETYIGGKVEAIESGVFRSDLPTKFKCKASAYQMLIDKLDRDLTYAIEVENKQKKEDIVNYEEVKEKIAGLLASLRDTPNREECPLIYHLDVAAMYPNIILTNRLQPPAIVTDEDCAACDFNRPGKTCLRQMEWVWRGEHYMANRSEYLHLKHQLMSEVLPPKEEGGSPQYWQDLGTEQQTSMLKDRLKKYCQKVYRRVLDKPTAEKKLAGICQRENPFYVDTVRAFRDRRYEYKGLNKVWKGKLESAKSDGNPAKIQEAADLVVLYDSLQLAHKCILNSFYGYVMRKGARWYSMEMAGVVTYTGANIIQRACRLIEQIGKPLELDTDGIWCCLPGSFPENFKLKNKNGKEIKISYPCVVLNVMVADHNTNEQYQTLVDPETKEYKVSSEMSIEFEVDGPYKAMILPASKEEGKLIKKRYAVFNPDGSLAELKGFEIKRRGELKLIKVFQSEVFSQFLEGGTLKECYDAVAAVANRWLDLLDTQGTDVTDEELIEYISESTTMAKSLEEYGDRKSTAITTAKRLGAFLGDDRIKDKGLNCHYVIAKKPENAPTSDRAIPVSIFSAEPAVARNFLRKWCGEVTTDDEGRVDVRDIIDWDYYRERLSNAIQKIITIPAAMQRVSNPVPRVRHPDWLHKKVREVEDRFQQRKLDGMFLPAKKPTAVAVDDLEDFGQASKRAAAEKDRIGRALTKGRFSRQAARDILLAPPTVTAGPQDGQAEDMRETPREPDEQTEPEVVMEGEDQENAGDTNNIANDKAEKTPAPAPAPEPPVRRREDYATWVKQQKEKWRQVRQERKRRKTEADKPARHRQAPAPATVQMRANLGEYYKQQGVQATRLPWQIVQITPSSSPGKYKVWAIVDSKLYTVMMDVPRTLYIDSILPPTHPAVAALGEKTSVSLPHGKTPNYVYKMVLPEEDYHNRRYELTQLLSAEHVKGVYENMVPLDVVASLHLGCVTKAIPSAQNKSIAEEFELNQLQMRTSVECEYLEGEGPEGLGAALRYAGLYYSSDIARGRGVYSLLMPTINKGLVVVVSSAGGPKEVTAALLEKYWRDALGMVLNQDHNTQEQVDLLQQVEFGIEYVSDPLDGARKVQRALLAFRERYRGPLLVAVQAPVSSSRLQLDIPLLGELPCADIPPHVDDSRYSSLQWQQRAARRAVYRTAAFGGWLRERVALARYAHIPLANLGGDPSVAVADALFARNLRDANHVLWMKDTSLPDLGMDSYDCLDDLLLDELSSAEVTNPGAYRTVSVQLKLHHLLICAIDKSHILADMEGGASIEEGWPAFKVLRTLVQSWLLDASAHCNPIADHLLQHLYRWCSHPGSRLHSPLLQQTLCRLMRKLFLQLLAEMKRLGATVVHATSTSLLINTNKTSLTAAVGYITYLTQAVKNRELFTWLELAPQKYWHTLLFRDKYNWGGIEATLSQRLQELSQSQPNMDSGSNAEDMDLDGDDGNDGDDGALSYLWNLQEHLPPAVREPFILMLTEFIYNPWKEARQAKLKGGTQGGSQALTATATHEQIQAEYLREAVRNQFTTRLLGMVTDINKTVHTYDDNPDHQFPKLAGSHLTQEQLGSPAVALVKFLCEIMSLDKRCEDEVSTMRRNALRCLHVKEFSEAATFHEPCLSFVMRDVICSFCNDCRDLDLCREPELQSGSWKCRGCSQHYDMAKIEARLVEHLHRASRVYQLQDLTCIKCKQVAAGHLQGTCTFCGGDLRNTISASSFLKGATIFANIAKHNNFQVLQHAAEWMQANNRRMAQTPALA